MLVALHDCDVYFLLRKECQKAENLAKDAEKMINASRKSGMTEIGLFVVWMAMELKEYPDNLNQRMAKSV